MLAQAYLAHRPEAVERLVLSSSGPADYARVWLPSLRLFVLLARVLPGWVLKESVRIGLGGLTRQLPQRERIEMADLIRVIVSQELSRADVVSHFAVAADVIRAQIVTPAALQNWSGDVMVLSAENDPTQSAKDVPRYQRLFGRRVHIVSLGKWVTPRYSRTRTATPTSWNVPWVNRCEACRFHAPGLASARLYGGRLGLFCSAAL